MPLFTFQDSIDTLMDFLGAENSEQARRDAIDATIDSHRELARVHQWSYLTKTCPILISGAYRTGTIEYDNFSNQIILTDGVWPTWAGFANLLIDTIVYRVKERVSDTVLKLSPHNAPVAAIPSGHLFTLSRDTYPIPNDVVQVVSASREKSRSIMVYVPPLEWANHRRLFPQPADPLYFTIMSDPQLMGVTSFVLSPPPTIDERINLVYHRALRDLKVVGYDEGKVSVGGNGWTVTGSTMTHWTKKHVGCVIRFSTNGDKPTGVRGDNPADSERIVTDVVDTHTLSLDAPAPVEGYTNVGYVISDPVDIDQPVMESAFKWCLRKNIAAIRSRANSDEIRSDYMSELRTAMGADNKYDDQPTTGGYAYPYMAGVMTSDLSYYKNP